MKEEVTYNLLKSKMKEEEVYHFSTEDCPNIINGYPYRAAIIFLETCETEGFDANYIGSRLLFKNIPLNDIIKKEAPELEEISLEDRKKVFYILYPGFPLLARTIEELENLLINAHVPTHKIKIK